MAKVLEELKDVNIKNQYNMDETGLYHRSMPNRMYITPGEHLCRKKLRGKKALKAKDRLSLIVCMNATGCRRVPLVAIGEAKRPEAFKHLGWPLTSDGFSTRTKRNRGTTRQSVRGGSTKFSCRLRVLALGTERRSRCCGTTARATASSTSTRTSRSSFFPPTQPLFISPSMVASSPPSRRGTSAR
eukprot:714301-Rhodomonas_salina.1